MDVQGLHQLFSLLETGTLKLPNEAWRRLAGTDQRREPDAWAQREGVGGWKDDAGQPGWMTDYCQAAKWPSGYAFHPPWAITILAL